jgi:hypothetical protein
MDILFIREWVVNDAFEREIVVGHGMPCPYNRTQLCSSHMRSKGIQEKDIDRLALSPV